MINETDFSKLKRGDSLVLVEDLHHASGNTIPKGTKAYVCDIRTYNDSIGIEFHTPTKLVFGHDCFGAGTDGHCLWLHENNVKKYFSFAEQPFHWESPWKIPLGKAVKTTIDSTPGLKITINSKQALETAIDALHGTEKMNLDIEKVMFNDPATIVFWKDGTKTVVKANNEPFDKEKGLAMAISKKALGNKGSYCDVFRKHIPDDSIVYYHKMSNDEAIIAVPKEIRHIRANDETTYIEFPDNLRLIYRDGKYVGWYHAE